MSRNALVLSFVTICLIAIAGCQSEPETTNAENTTGDGPTDQYGLPIPEVPDLNVPEDLSALSLAEVRLLRNELYARKGWLFRDAILRTYFFQHREWYHPMYEYDQMRGEFSKEEAALLEQLKAREQALLENNLIVDDGRQRINTANLANPFQFGDTLLQRIAPVLAREGLAIAPSRNEQLFYAYDQNNYETVPNFITSDLFLQLIHTYFSYELRELEAEQLAKAVAELTGELYDAADALHQSMDDKALKDAAAFNMVYFGIAHQLITGKQPEIPEGWKDAYAIELEAAQEASGKGSEFFRHPFFDYSMFRPRGHYTRNEALERYFRTMMWLQNP
ncbi:MAG: DUF3160 domain-containing protein, partial [Bacteroidota bacterium]